MWLDATFPHVLSTQHKNVAWQETGIVAQKCEADKLKHYAADVERQGARLRVLPVVVESNGAKNKAYIDLLRRLHVYVQGSARQPEYPSTWTTTSVVQHVRRVVDAAFWQATARVVRDNWNQLDADRHFLDNVDE